MDRVNGADFVDIGGGRRGFRSQNLGDGVAGTEVTAAFLNGAQESLVGTIETAGLAPDTADWSLFGKARRMLRLRETLVDVGGGGVTIAAADESKTYLLNLATRETITLPNPDDVPDGFSVAVATTGDPSGFQSAYVDVGAGSGSADIAYRGFAHDPFYLIGRGEVFQFSVHDGEYVAYLLAQPGDAIVYRTTTGLATTVAVPGAWADLTLNQVSAGSSTLFDLNPTTTAVPVTGIYFFRGSMRAAGTTAVYRPFELGMFSSGAVPQTVNLETENHSNTQSLQILLTFPFVQGEVFSIATRAEAGEMLYYPNKNEFSVGLVGR